MIDVIGIGLGPFNLSLAALLTKTPAISSQFFEQKPCFNWHKNMILPHTTLQVPFLADLVSLIDPTSPFSFLNYLHCHQRLLKFYFLEGFEIFRQEYNHYCQWVVGRLSGLNFSATVTEAKAIDGGYQVTVCQNQKTHSHGVGSGDLGLGAYRAGCIVNQLAGRAIYDTKGLDIFQQFGMAK